MQNCIYSYFLKTHSKPLPFQELHPLDLKNALSKFLNEVYIFSIQYYTPILDYLSGQIFS